MPSAVGILGLQVGEDVKKIVMGLGWDPIKKKGLFGFSSRVDVDLDASCVLFDEQNQVLDVVWFRQLASRDGSVQHTGDNRTGDGAGDDEQILVNLAQVPANVRSLAFVVNSFTGQDFSQIDNATCRLVNADNGQEVARYNLSCQGAHTAQIMAKVYRHNNEWKMHAIGENCSGHTFHDLTSQIVPYL